MRYYNDQKIVLKHKNVFCCLERKIMLRGGFTILIRKNLGKISLWGGREIKKTQEIPNFNLRNFKTQGGLDFSKCMNYKSLSDPLLKNKNNT